MSLRNRFFKISESEAKCDEILEKLKELEANMLRVESKIIEGKRQGRNVSEYEQIYSQYVVIREGLKSQLNYWVQILKSEQG